MSKFFTGAILFAALFLVGCSHTKTVDEGVTYMNDEIGITLRHPGSFTVRPATMPPGEGLIKLDSATTSYELFIERDTAVPSFDSITEEWFCRRFTSGFCVDARKGEVGGVSLRNDGAMKTPAGEWRWFEYSAYEPSYTRKYYLAISGGPGLRVDVEGSERPFSEEEVKEFESIITSIQIR